MVEICVVAISRAFLHEFVMTLTLNGILVCNVGTRGVTE